MITKLKPGIWQVGELIYEIERDSAIHGYQITVIYPSGDASVFFIPDVLLAELSPLGGGQR